MWQLAVIFRIKCNFMIQFSVQWLLYMLCNDNLTAFLKHLPYGYFHRRGLYSTSMEDMHAFKTFEDNEIEESG